MAGLLGFAVGGIGGGQIRGNPAPDILAEVSAGGFFDGFAPTIKLIPKEGVVLLPLGEEGGISWFAALSGSGPVFLKAERSARDTVVSIAEHPPLAVLESLARLSAGIGSGDDFDLEVVFDPGE